MFANVGLVQLNYGFGAKVRQTPVAHAAQPIHTPQEINALVDSVRADGIYIHVNHLQEAVQPEGDLNFENLYQKLAEVLPQIKVPVIVKEVGHGFDQKTAQRLYDLGIKNIDVAGVGGSSWAWIEGRRQTSYKVP